VAKKSKDPIKSLNKLLDRAKDAESGVAALARRAEVSAKALAGAVRQLESLVARQLGSPATPAAPAAAPAKRTTRRKTKTASKRAPAKRAPSKRTPKAE
jgi:hypothetical protein